MKKLILKRAKYIRRKKRVGAKIFGEKSRPRLSVFKSNTHIYAQLVDDVAQATMAASSDLGIKKTDKMTKIQSAEKVGEDIAKKAVAKKIKKVIFDRNGFRYHGRVKALADGARKGGLEF